MTPEVLQRGHQRPEEALLPARPQLRGAGSRRPRLGRELGTWVKALGDTGPGSI